MKTILLTLFAVLFFYSQCYSNGLQLSSGTLTGQNVTSNYTYVQFDLSWENSWRDAVNWDAAWIFIKYKSTYDSTWNHATLSTTATHHIVGSGYTVIPADGVGVFIYRDANGNGTVSLDDVQLRWNYGTDGLNDADLVEVKVFGIEMVYVPEGSFYVGDGTTSNITGQFSAGNTTNPFLITGEGELTLGGTSTSNLGNRNASGMTGGGDDFNFTTTQTLPAAYPKGYDQFFCMKYEISQGQYTDFLNTLTRYKQNQRTETDVSTDVITDIYVMSGSSSIYWRNVIRCPASGNGTTEPIVFSCDRPDRACNDISWMDGCAYMDWAGLRPMTELEFEKSCRGSLTPVADEYVWGTNTIVPDVSLTISGTETGTEYITTDVSLGGCCYGYNTHIGGDAGAGPLRCGIFARNTTTRISSGATFYGIMEMSGNVVERTVSVGHSYGRSFDGLHGDGELSVNGHANVTNWPYTVGGEVTGAAGSNRRGGDHYSPSLDLRISDRLYGRYSYSSRSATVGMRGVRSTTVILDKLLKKNNSNNR